MVRFQIASDLHIEYEDNNDINPFNYIIPNSNILILAGDIGSLYKIDQLTLFLKKLSKLFEIILYIPGNHEYYTMKGYQNLSLNLLINRLNDIEKTIKNLYILNRNSVLIDKICIAGCTLWSNPNQIIPPFIVRIFGFNTKKYKNSHIEDLNYINKMIEYCKKNNFKLIIVTHYPPTNKVIKYPSKKKDKYISLYVNNLDYLLDEKKIDTWICGHIHQNFDFKTDKNCRIVGNQKGKPKDKINDYKNNFIIEF